MTLITTAQYGSVAGRSNCSSPNIGPHINADFAIAVKGFYKLCSVYKFIVDVDIVILRMKLGLPVLFSSNHCVYV